MKNNRALIIILAIVLCLITHIQTRRMMILARAVETLQDAHLAEHLGAEAIENTKNLLGHITDYSDGIDVGPESKEATQ